MKFLWFLFLVFFPLFGANILDYNIYPRDDRVDITFSFDGPYDLGISQNKKGNIVIFTLNAKISKEEDKTINSKIIKKVKIFSEGEKTFIALNIGDDVDIKADTIGDKFGLRLRAQKKDSFVSQEQPVLNNQTTTGVNMQEYDFTNYILVVSVLVLLLIVLWFFKNYLKQKHPIDRNFNMIFQRSLDRNNQLIVFEYGLKRYIMIIGNSNVVLETSDALEKNENINSQKSQEKDFDSYFEANKQRLQNLISKQNN
ncbi:hypothetical protein [Campylobacter armoricus]|uniref:Putative membrane protein n=1 Tax=Campylobacter armoricus TaxID=2505970 RepID=A0A7L5HIK8_9BACT|nr:hypothetical protein [Campylobacter armoricus]QKF79095.1 putative membrane protein [Campylobacter armoricus]